MCQYSLGSSLVVWKVQMNQPNHSFFHHLGCGLFLQLLEGVCFLHWSLLLLLRIFPLHHVKVHSTVSKQELRVWNGKSKNFLWDSAHFTWLWQFLFLFKCWLDILFSKLKWESIEVLLFKLKNENHDRFHIFFQSGLSYIQQVFINI